MHRIIPAAAITCWVVVITYSIVAIFTPMHPLRPLQEVIRTGAAVTSIIWYMRRGGIELVRDMFRTGYRIGCKDNKSDDHDR